MEQVHYTTHYKQETLNYHKKQLHYQQTSTVTLLFVYIHLQETQDFDYGEESIVWQDVIKNTITDHPFDPRTPLSSAQLLKEIRNLIQIVGVVYCEREGAPGIQSELKNLNLPVVNVDKDLISNSKRKDSSQTNEYNEFHQQHSLAIHSIEIVINNGIELNRLLKKRKKPKKQQRIVK